MSTRLDPVKSTPYMSVVEDREPRQKVHTHLSHAKNAFDTPKRNTKTTHKSHTHGWGAIFEYKNDDWVEIISIPQPTDADVIVGKSIYYPYDPTYDYETRPWRKKDHGSYTGDEGVRAAEDQEAESARDRGKLGRVSRNGGCAPRDGNDQRTPRRGDDPARQELREKLLQEVKLADSLQEQYAEKFGRQGWAGDRDLMNRYRERRDTLVWVIEEMDK